MIALDVDAEDLPVALRRVHREVGDRERLRLEVHAPVTIERLTDVFDGAGFGWEREPRRARGRWVVDPARRRHTLCDTIGPGMRLLLVGLNPSVVAADAGYGFAGPSNRFWKAAVAAGVVTEPRDPDRALAVDRVGMTDLVKRPTPRASLVEDAEFRHGAERIARLAVWLEPAVVCFVGLQGWRAAVDRRATVGWQPGGCGGRPAYVMPSTSGLNASARLEDLVDHLRVASAGPPPA